MKRVTSALAFVLGVFTTFSSAAQIQGFISGYAPGDVTEKRDAKGVESESDLHSDFVWSLGAEFLTFPVGPLMAGGGLGYFSMQKDGGDNIVMPVMPLWGSIGVIAPEEWKARPYFVARIGYPVPMSTFKTWWNYPSNFYFGGNVGVQLPYHMGVEFNCTYLTMNKQFKKLADASFRLSSLKFGGSITVHFDLFKNSSEAAPVVPAEKANAAEEPAAEEFSYGYTAPEENAEPAPAEEQPAEDSVNADAVEEPVAEDAAPEDAPAEESTEAAPEEQETPAAEAPAEETPAEEPAAEPAPAPEKKPAAKKSSKKKTAKKAPAKKKTTTKKKTATKKKR